jgi:hypothetical protein
MPVRRVPRVGERVAVAYLSVMAAGEVTGLDEGGRRIRVMTAEGEELVFVLNRATGRFHIDGDPFGARLLFEPD